MKSNERRAEEIQKTLVWTFALNLSVCLIKVYLGLATGIMAIAADGMHSLGDTLSNVVGFCGIRLAKKSPDKTHGYGYERFEAVATLLIVGLISITCYRVLEGGIARLFHPQPVSVNPAILIVMAVSMAINVATICYEGRAGKRLRSKLLIADSNETKSDLWVSGGVIACSLIISRTGWFWLDGAVSVLIGILIIRVIADIIVPTARQLADAQVVDPSQVVEIVMAVSGAKFCHAVRSRGHLDAFFLDLHLGVESGITIDEAHDDVCHRTKLALHNAYPGLKSANIHIEPNNEAGATRANSVFRRRDSYDYKESQGG